MYSPNPHTTPTFQLPSLLSNPVENCPKKVFCIRHRARSCLMALILGSMILSTRSGSAPAEQIETPLQIVATVGMVGNIVTEVAGDRAVVENLIGEGVDPHLYKPTRTDVVKLSRAELVFYNGLHLEGKMAAVLEGLASLKRPVVAVTENVLQDEGYVLNKEGNIHDPHVWMDVSGWMRAVEAVMKTLADFDPDHSDIYRERGQAYLSRLRGLDAYAREVLSTIPENRRVLVTAHDAFNYLGRAYGLEVLGIQGLSTESEAGVQDVENLVNLLVERQVPAVFVESSVADKNVRALVEGARSRGHSVTIGGALFSDAMGPPGTYEGSYIGMIDHNVTMIATALGGEAPTGGWQGLLQEVDR